STESGRWWGRIVEGLGLIRLFLVSIVAVVQLRSLHPNVGREQLVILHSCCGDMEVNRWCRGLLQRLACRALECGREVLCFDRGLVFIVKDDGQCGTVAGDRLGEPFDLNQGVAVAMVVPGFVTFGVVRLGSG